MITTINKMIIGDNGIQTIIQEDIEFDEVEFAAVCEEERIKRMQLDREAALNALSITISTGKTFNGNKSSLADLHMAIQTAALAGLPDTYSMNWRLFNNDKPLVTLAEIKEAYLYGSFQYSQVFLTFE